jgi:hypothetical protein
MSKKINVTFPNKIEEMKREIAFYSKHKIKVVLTYGVNRKTKHDPFICDCYKKAQCKSAGKHPIASLFPNGSKDATHNEDFLCESLEKYPNANLAILIEDFTVFDIDDPNQIKWLKQFDLPKTRCTRTSRGWHYYFSDILDFKPQTINGIEIKTKGLITVPPSQHQSGKYYRKIS